MSKKFSKKKPSIPKLPFSFRRNLVPPIVGLLVMGLVFVALNAQWLAAKTVYHFHKPTPIVVQAADPSSGTVKHDSVSPSPTLIIPSLGVKAPIIFEPSTVEWKVQLALRNGVDHYGTTANPGQNGNVVIFGHSSGLLWAPGDYKFVFTMLDKLGVNDQIIIDYQGTRYTYKANSTEVILPTNLSILSQHSSRPMLSLVTCTPVGTSRYRLVVHAEQVSPNPAGAVGSLSSNVRFPTQLPR